MQYQKSEVKERILRAACEEFLRRGFLGARISSIAESACVPVGNLYRYFSCKDVLFEAVVGQAFTIVPQKIARAFANNQIKNIVDKPIKDSADKNMTVTDGMKTETIKTSGAFASATVWEEFIEVIIALFEEFGKEIVILMDGSDGSDFSEFSRIVCDICLEFFVRRGLIDTNDDRVFYGLLNRSAVDMVLHLFRSGDKELFEKLLRRLMVFASALSSGA